MPRHIPVLLACPLLVGLTAEAEAQAPIRQPIGLVAKATIISGRIEGLVRDDGGTAIQGANIVALGVTLASALSDEKGRFSLAVPPGEYMLRASRQGYVSSFRQLVRVGSSLPLERNITLVRLNAVELRRPAAIATTQVPAPNGGEEHPHNEMAWRLRHTTRNVLRDTSPSNALPDQPHDTEEFRPAGSFLDRALHQSARAATNFFTATDFNGQIHLLTTSSLAPARGWQFDQPPRGIASVAVGARVGDGDWRVRGAVTSQALSSWVLLGEYQTREEGAHAFRVGMSYAVQGDLEELAQPTGAIAVQHRSLGAVHASDRWRPYSGVELEYGARLDRSDYVELQQFISPRVSSRAMILPRTFILAGAAQHVVLPGGSEFLPPPSNGLWIPPERTFASLIPDAAFHAELVRHAETGVGLTLDADGARTLSVRRFRQNSTNQIATLFGVRRDASAADYYVATPGSVDVAGWSVRYEGALVRRLSGSVEYSLGDADWRAARQIRHVRRFAPSAARGDRERMHDLTMAVAAEIPESSTWLSIAYRLNSAFSQDARESRDPALGGRFDIEMRQMLPYRPTHGSTLELVFAARSLSRDLREPGSLYDELLTVAPPMRVLGGVQVRF
jgi:hypothetical protein